MVEERTLFILKPDATMRRYTGAKVFDRLLHENFEFYGMKEYTVSRTLAEKHYSIHKGKRFYAWLIDFITGGPVIPVIIEGKHAVSRVRNLLGATLVQNANAETLRGRYGIWGGINIAHASDAVETAVDEIALWNKYGGLDEQKKCRDKIQRYCSQWGSLGFDYTRDIRNICVKVLEETDQDSIKKAETLLAAYLEKECVGFPEKHVKSLAHLIIRHVLLQR
ncbi:MAG: nucleoside-diphosphate kinase [Candidatus Ranarchaeia archaeon]